MDQLEPDEELFDASTGEIFSAPDPRNLIGTRIPDGVIAPRLFKIENWYGLELFVKDLMHDTERATPGIRWCPKWFKHPEAITIFYALYLSYQSRTDPDQVKAMKSRGENPDAGMNSWLIHELFPQMSYLLSEEGPFRECSDIKHTYKEHDKRADPNWAPYRPVARISEESSSACST